MASLEQFLRTGHFGPLALGLSPSNVLNLLGEPTDISKKSNPLDMRYGRILLSFLTSAGTNQLREIVIDFSDEDSLTPRALIFQDLPTDSQMTLAEFKEFTNAIGCHPLSTDAEDFVTELIFPSDVSVFFRNNLLARIGIVQRAKRQRNSPPPNYQYQGPSSDISQIFHEAQIAAQAGALRAAILVAWAGLETAIRNSARQEDLDTSRSSAPSVLLHQLLAAGKITSMEHRALQNIRQIRTKLAHGIFTNEIETSEEWKSAINMLMDVSSRLMSVSVTRSTSG